MKILIRRFLLAIILVYAWLILAGCTPANIPLPVGMNNPAEDKTLVLITQKFVSGNNNGEEKIVGDIRQQRNMNWIFDQNASDPRLVGKYEIWFNIDSRPDGSGEMWGTAQLTTNDGVWKGAWTGAIASGQTPQYMVGEFFGSGAYEGLEWHNQSHFVGSGAGFTTDIEIVGTGWITGEE